MVGFFETHNDNVAEKLLGDLKNKAEEPVNKLSSVKPNDSDAKKAVDCLTECRTSIVAAKQSQQAPKKENEISTPTFSK